MKGETVTSKTTTSIYQPTPEEYICIYHLMQLMTMILNKHYILLLSRISFPLIQALHTLSKIYHGVFSKVNFSLLLETRGVICV